MVASAAEDNDDNGGDNEGGAGVPSDGEGRGSDIFNGLGEGGTGMDDLVVGDDTSPSSFAAFSNDTGATAVVDKNNDDASDDDLVVDDDDDDGGGGGGDDAASTDTGSPG